MNQFDEHTFEMGWFNHQLEKTNGSRFRGFRRWGCNYFVGKQAFFSQQKRIFVGVGRSRNRSRKDVLRVFFGITLNHEHYDLLPCL